MLGSPITVGPLNALDFPCDDAVATVIMAHGIGLGPWMFEPWVDTFHAWKLRVIALVLPGHAPGEDSASVTLDSTAEALAQAVLAVPGSVVLMGHSMGALAVQMVAARPDMQHLRGVVLLCPLPSGQVRLLPERGQVLHMLSVMPALLGRSVHPGLSDYKALGFNKMEPQAAQQAWERTVPWPAALTRAFTARPKIEPTALTQPILVAIGFHDKVLPWQKTRVLGDLYEAVVWRYDDLGHMPPLEHGGVRMGRDIAKWCVTPTRPQVIESEGFGPAEGVGHLLRRARRGELMKKRSAYGQKKAAR